MTLQEAQAQIDQILGTYRTRTASGETLLSGALTPGKVYEAWVLCQVLQRLHGEEGYDVELQGAPGVRLKSSPGPINRSYPHFRLTAPGNHPLEVWTDVEFLSLSASVRGVPPEYAARCDYHELDVVVVPAGTSGRPGPTDVRVGVECKNLTYRKELLRALLGVRRELSLLTDATATGFRYWPRDAVPAQPPSCLLAYGTDPAIGVFSPPGSVFGIDFVHLPLP
jgi:hypothetical protein